MFFSYGDYDGYEQSYANENFSMDDTMDLVIESYINDQTIFETVLRRDFMEATGILTDASDDNFLVKMWNTICEFCEKIRKKILEIYDSFCKKIDEHKKNKARKIVDKYKKYYNDSDAAEILKEYSIKNFKMKLDALKDCGDKESEKFIDSMLSDTKDIPYVDQMSKDEIEKMQEEMDDKSSKSELRDEAEEKIFGDDDIEKPLEKNSATIIKEIQNTIIKRTEEIRSLKLGKRKINDEIKKLRKDANKKLASIRKDKYSDSDYKNDEKEKAHAYLKMLNSYKKFVSNIVSVSITMIGKVYKECVTLYTGAGEFLKNKIERKKELDKKGKSNNTSNSNPSNSTVGSYNQHIDRDDDYDAMNSDDFHATYRIAECSYYDGLGEAAVLELEIMGL